MKYLIIFAIIALLDPFLYCKELIHRISSPNAASIRVAAVMHDLKHVRLAYCPNLAIMEQCGCKCRVGKRLFRDR